MPVDFTKTRDGDAETGSDTRARSSRTNASRRMRSSFAFEDSEHTGNPHLKYRAAALPVGGRHTSAISLHDRLRDRQPEAGVAVGGRVVGAVGEEAIEDAAEVFFGDSGALVSD